MQLTKEEIKRLADWLKIEPLILLPSRSKLTAKMIEELRAAYQNRLIKIETIIGRNNTCVMTLYLDDPDFGFTKLFEAAGQDKNEVEVYLVLEYLTMKKVPVQLTIEFEDFFDEGLEEKILSFFANYPPEIRHINYEGGSINEVETRSLHILDISLTHERAREYTQITFDSSIDYKKTKVVHHPKSQRLYIILFKK